MLTSCYVLIALIFWKGHNTRWTNSRWMRQSNLFYYIFWISLNMIYWTFYTRRKYIKFLSFVLSCIKIDLNKTDFLENINQFFEILKLSHKDVLGFIYCTEFYYDIQTLCKTFMNMLIMRVIIQNILSNKLDVFISSAML